MNNLDLAPPLARELKDRVNTAARHAIAQTLAHLHQQKPGRLHRAAQQFRWEAEYNAILSAHEVLTEMIQAFPRPHGRACLSCYRRPVFVTMGHTTTDFCQPCLERIEEMQYRRHR